MHCRFAEKIRKQLQDAQFSHGTNPLRVTASVGIAQLRPEEMRGGVTDRVEQALLAAQQAGGNVCYRHDGENCVPVSSAFQAKTGHGSVRIVVARRLLARFSQRIKQVPKAQTVPGKRSRRQSVGPVAVCR